MCLHDFIKFKFIFTYTNGNKRLILKIVYWVLEIAYCKQLWGTICLRERRRIHTYVLKKHKKIMTQLHNLMSYFSAT